MKDHTTHHKHHSTHDDSLGALLDRCGHIFAHRVGGKNRGQDNVLALIAQHPGISQKELAEALSIQPASVSELIRKLERKGLILREKDERDLRSIRVRLTDEGQALLAKPAEEMPDPFQALSQEEQEQLRRLLEKLLADWSRHRPGEHGHHHHHAHHHDKENPHGKHE